MNVRVTKEYPYADSQSRLFLDQFDHVITVFLDADGGRWASDVNEKPLLDAIERWKPTAIVSADVDFNLYPNLLAKYGDRIVRLPKALTGGNSGELFTAQRRAMYTELATFLADTGLLDYKVYVLYPTSYGTLYDDMIRDAGIPSMEYMQIDTLADLRKALRTIPSGKTILISDLPFVQDVEFGVRILPEKIHKLIQYHNVVDISVSNSYGAISVIAEYPHFDFREKKASLGSVLIYVNYKRLSALGLGRVPVIGMKHVDGITQ